MTLFVTMTSPRRNYSPLTPKSPFSPINENEKIFQLTMEDVEANRTIIPSNDNVYNKGSYLGLATTSRSYSFVKLSY